MSNSEKMTEINTWWGRHRQAHDRHDLWSIGPVDLISERKDHFWRFTWRHLQRSGSFPIRRSMGVAAESLWTQSAASLSEQPSKSFSALSRYYLPKSSSLTVPSASPNEDLIFSPVYPMGPLRVDLRSPVTLGTGERLNFGFLIPLSIQIELAPTHGGSRAVAEVPIHPLSKTWNGPSPTSGNIAFIANPSLTIERWSDHTPRLDFAACPLSIFNQSGVSQTVQSLLIPTNRLSLFHSPQTGFWSDTVNIEISEQQPIGTEKVFPKDAGQPVLVKGARYVPATSAFQRERR